MNAPDLERCLHTAVEAARAGANALKNRASSATVLSRVNRDIKLKGDKESEKEILGLLMENFPYPALSEEAGALSGSEEKDSSEYRWIVDPLDGTFNFLREMPLNAVSIALWRRDQPVLGVIYDFNREEMFTGIVGHGAWLNEKPMTTSSVSEKGRCVLFTGFPISQEVTPQAVQEVYEGIKGYGRIRMIGAAAVSLAYVACGRGDAYEEKGIRLWDVAAGLALVQAAGGFAQWRPLSQPHTLWVRAQNGKLQEKS